jgi:hypothetical protein
MMHLLDDLIISFTQGDGKTVLSAVTGVYASSRKLLLKPVDFFGAL